ncbi:MAG TPA: hypothetical protein VFD23_00175 [Clostridia bacterium]|nr:hypothetical protein [Clostridia bacterium]
MKFKNVKKKRQSTSKYNLPTRKQSFTGFSQSYTGKHNQRKLSYSERMRRRKILKRVLVVLGFVALFIVGYLIVSVMLNISEIPPEAVAALINH